MFTEPPPDGSGLLIEPCDSIHMFFMKFPIDAVFMDKKYKIVKIVRNLAVGKIVGVVKGAYRVLEIPAGTLPESFRQGSSLSASRIN